MVARVPGPAAQAGLTPRHKPRTLRRSLVLPSGRQGPKASAQGTQTQEERGEAGWEGGMQSGSSAVPRPPPSRCSRQLWGLPAPFCCPRTAPAFRPLTSDDQQPLSLQLPACHLGLDVPPSWPSSETLLLGHHTSPAAQARKRGHPNPSPPRHPPPPRSLPDVTWPHHCRVQGGCVERAGLGPGLRAATAIPLPAGAPEAYTFQAGWAWEAGQAAPRPVSPPASPHLLAPWVTGPGRGDSGHHRSWPRPSGSVCPKPHGT